MNCTICGEQVFALWVCSKHYTRNRRYGDPLLTKLDRDHPSGCSVPGCDYAYLAKGFCNRHYHRWSRFGDVEANHREGDSHWDWKGDSAGYNAFHMRVYNARGAASRQHCSRADESCSGRLEWANLTGNYADIMDFAPMCAGHHRRYDAERRVLAARAGK